MGGIMSGVRGWRGGKRATSQLPEVRLTHASTAHMGWRGIYVRPEGEDWATIVHPVHEWLVMIERTPLHFGGWRRWLVCPCCQSRHATLYIVTGVLACRICLGLRYESQHENARSRLFRQADAIRARLGWKPGILSPDGAKPHRMHWRKYLGLRAELAGLTNALLGSLGEWADKAASTRCTQPSN